MPTALLNRSKLEAAYIGFHTAFTDGLTLAPNLWERIATRVPSTQETESYKWMGDLPQLKEWIGDRILHKLRAQDYSIKNKDWANGIEVDRNDILYDRLGIVRPRIQMLGMAAREHYDQLVFDLLVKGFGSTYGLCYDGQYFFDSDHRDVTTASVQSNTSTAALSESTLNAAWLSMAGRANSDGQPLLIQPTTLVVGPSNRVTALNLLKERLADGADNINAGLVDLIIAPRLTGTYANYWFLLDLSKPIKPLILQVFKEIEFVALDSMDDLHAFMRKTFMYGCDGIHNVGYGLWQLAYGSTGAS